MIEEEPPPRKHRELGADLSRLSVADLTVYIADLRAEIARVEADIAAKQAHQQAAKALFR